MEIREKRNKDKLIIFIHGRIDTTTSTMLLEHLEDSITTTDDLTLDFQDVVYISSAGLRVLLCIQKAMDSKNGKMIIKHINKIVMETFKITGFTDILNIVK